MDHRPVFRRAAIAAVGLAWLAACAPAGPSLSGTPSAPAPAASPTASPTPTQRASETSPPALAETPPAGRWIEVDLSDQRVFLREDGRALAEYPIASGAAVSAETATYPGDYTIRAIYPGPEESAPGVFVRDIVIFDWEHGIGFHSQPMDAEGKILDETIGTPATAGCIRMAESGALYDFASPGMLVRIHD